MTHDPDASRAADAVAPATAGPETAIDPRLTEVGVRKIDATGSGLRMELEIAQEVLGSLANAAMTLVDHTGAENYVEMQFRHPDKPEMVTLTIQRFLGQTPHQKRQEAEARVATLEARLRDAERTGALAAEVIAQWYDEGSPNDISVALSALQGHLQSLAATRAAPRGDDAP